MQKKKNMIPDTEENNKALLPLDRNLKCLSRGILIGFDVCRII
jgi:hypothetical protein